jgi:hypothetical protein
MGEKVGFKDRINRSVMFPVYHDQQVFNQNINIPSITMIDDNDNETEWGEIN